MSNRILKRLTTVTHCVADLDVAESAWRDYLGFHTVDAGALGDDLCTAWDTPAALGQRYCLMRPASGEPVFLRFVETGEHDAFGPPASCGWCAAEYLVRDPDALAARLVDSPFQRLAGPADLFPRPKAPRAMQMIGPSGELVYFTRILPGGSQYGMKGAKSDVDRVFIVPVGGTSMPEMHEFYGTKLGLRTMQPTAFINPIMAYACGVSPNTVFPTAIVPLPGRRFLIELDQLPPDTSARPRRAGHLPGAMAMVSFDAERLDDGRVAFRAPPVECGAKPYDGRKTGVITGPAGEWLELIETPQAAT